MDISKRFPTRASFESYWNEHYLPVTYEDVRSSFESFVASVNGHIFLSDYEESGCISKTDFRENLSQEARFMFEDGLTEVFYDRNPELYEIAFALFEEAQLSGSGMENAGQIFHDVFRELYETFLDRLFDEKLSATRTEQISTDTALS